MPIMSFNTVDIQSKPTDSKRYLNPNSFHPRSIFRSIPFSQMLRTLRNNSKTETGTSELDLVLKHFEKSGYKTDNNEVNDTLVFPVHYFDGIKNFRALIRSLNNELETLIGVLRSMW